MTEELQPLTLQDRGEARTLDLSTPEGVKQFKDGFIENAAKGKGIDRLQYFQGLLILDVSGVLEQDPNLQKAVIKSGQDPLIWQGVYEGVKNSAEVLQNPDASPQQKQIAQQNLQAYFRITKITRMDISPADLDPAVPQIVLQAWQATWKGLNYWLPLLQEEGTPKGESAPAAGPDATLSKNAGIEENVQFTLTTENRATVEEIFDELRNELRAKKDSVYFTWAVMHSKSAHQRALSTLLGLDDNIDAAALERAQTRLEIARECDLSDGATLVTLVKNQPELLQRLFAQASPEIQQAFTQFQGDSDAFTFRFKRLIEQASGVTKEDLDTESDLITQAYNQTKEFNRLLLAESQPPIEELIQAFITLNQMRIALDLHQSKLESARSSYYGILTAKAELKIEKGDYNNPVLLDLAEEQGARLDASGTIPAAPPPAPVEAEPDIHTLFAELQQVAKKRPPDEAYDPERARIRDMRKDQLQLILSEILGLSEDRSYVSEAERLRHWHKIWSYFIGNDRQLHDLLSPQQIQLAGELFAQGSPDLQEAFENFRNEGREGTGRDLMNLQDHISKLANEIYVSEKKQAEDTRGREYMTRAEQIDYESLFWDLLAKEPLPSDDELTQAFIKQNQAIRDQVELNELELKGINQFITDLAQKAGLEIVKEKGIWGFELVRKNTPPVATEPAPVPSGTGPAQPAVSPQPPEGVAASKEIEEKVRSVLQDPEKREAVERIFDEARSEWRASGSSKIYLPWGFMLSDGSYARALSTLLDLDDNTSARTLELAEAEREKAREHDLLERSNLTSLMASQPELLQKLFSQASPEIQQAFTQCQGNRDSIGLKGNLSKLIVKASGITEEYLAISVNLMRQEGNQERRFAELLLSEKSQPGVEELIQAFIAYNQSRITHALQDSRLERAKSNYFDTLAAKAGLKITTDIVMNLTLSEITS